MWGGLANAKVDMFGGGVAKSSNWNSWGQNRVIVKLRGLKSIVQLWNLGVKTAFKP
jgi:hypothetical protein